MKKILVIQTASIGDVILATALLEKLHHFYPDARIDFLVKKDMQSLFNGHPFINRLLIWDKSVKYRSFFRLIKDVRSERYDFAINIQRFALTGILTALSGAKATIGFDKNPLSWAFSNRIPHKVGNGIHETQRNQRLIAEITDENVEKPKLYPEKIQHPVSGIYYTISPASLWFTKQYPAERWAELIGQMSEEAMVYLLGSKADFELCEEIRDTGYGIRGSRIVNLAGQLSLLESAALMQGARMNFTNDSAPMHLASAVNAPVSAVYCSTTPDFGFGPLSDNRAIVEVQTELSCRPCGLHGRTSCPEGHFRCAVDINMETLRSRL